MKHFLCFLSETLFHFSAFWDIVFMFFRQHLKKDLFLSRFLQWKKNQSDWCSFMPLKWINLSLVFSNHSTIMHCKPLCNKPIFNLKKMLVYFDIRFRISSFFVFRSRASSMSCHEVEKLVPFNRSKFFFDWKMKEIFFSPRTSTFSSLITFVIIQRKMQISSSWMFKIVRSKNLHEPCIHV